VLVHEVEAEKVRVPYAEEEVPGDEDERHDRHAEARAEVVQEAYRAEEERAGGRGSQRKDEAGEAFGEPRQRKTAPEQEGSE